MTGDVLRIHGKDGDSQVIVGGNLSEVNRFVSSEKAVIITDVNVAKHYRVRFPAWPVIEIGTGEKIKNLATVQEIYRRFLELGLDRRSFVVGIGGGIVCDIAGFAASTYMRGMSFGFVASTWLAQVDAGIGGKNGVNFEGYKNMVGVFRQPEFVICDTTLLRTLPPKEIACGFAEVIKYALIGDPDLFQYLEKRHHEALLLEDEVIQAILGASVRAKIEIVNRDEKEAGLRRNLNFGHTFGHAIEKYSSATHGEAVAAGMALAAGISENRGYLKHGEVERITSLLEKMELPTSCSLGVEKFSEAIRKDKKRRGDAVDVVMLLDIGTAAVETIPLRELEQELRKRLM